MKILKKDEDIIVECNNCGKAMPLEMKGEGGGMLFICEDCGTRVFDLDGDVIWKYPKMFNKPDFKEINLEEYYTR